MTDTRVLLVGHSHANCMAAAIKTKTYRPDPASYTVSIVGNGAACLPSGLVLTDSLGRKVPNPIVARAIADNVRIRSKPRVWLVSVLGGNYASRISLFRGETEYQTILPGEEHELRQEEVLLTEQALVDTVTMQLGSLKEFFALLPRAQLAGLIHVEAPPPVRDPAFILENLPEKTRMLAPKAGINDLSIESISDADYRRRVWVCQSRATRGVTESVGGIYFPPPPDTMDEAGFLIERYRADAMHASTEYGAHVLRALEKYIVTATERTDRDPA